jgi:hypothetical protein
MRTQLLCTSALVLSASALLCGPEAARAQTWPAYSSNGYYQAYGSGYRPYPAPYGYANSAQGTASAWVTPYAGAYASYPNYYSARSASPYGGYPANGYGYNNAAGNAQEANAFSPPSAATGRAAPTGLQPAVTATGDATAELPTATVAGAAADQSPPKDKADAPPAPTAGACAADVVLPPLAADPDGHAADDGHGSTLKGHHWFEDTGKDRFWATIDYNIAFIRPMKLNTPLVTTGATTEPNGALVPFPGALGEPTTAVLFGSPVDFGMFNGIRAELGAYLDCDQILSVDWAGQWLYPKHVRFATASDAAGNPLIARPEFNVITGTETSAVYAEPGVFAGSSAVDVRSEMFGTEANFRLNVNDAETGTHGDVLLGFRYLRLQERLSVVDQFQPLIDGVVAFNGADVPPGNSLGDFDSFQSTNDFYGMQLGGRLCWSSCWCFLSVFGKIALGVTEEQVDINGSTTLFTPGGTTVARGGFLALPSNIGHYDRTVFAFVPEGGLNVGVRLTPHLLLTAGYSFLYWDKIVRPGDVISRAVNPTAVPTSLAFGAATGPTAPVFHFSDEPFWVHSLNFGLNFHY